MPLKIVINLLYILDILIFIFHKSGGGRKMPFSLHGAQEQSQIYRVELMV
jgi:hypothetical protein